TTFYMTFPSCKVFTAFESTQCRAGRAEFDGVLARISVQADNTQLDFSHFWQEQSWTTAVHAATEADIIVVSLSGRVDLPVPVKRWMETWPQHGRANQAALVVVFESGREELPAQNDLITYCQKLAEQHGLSFFCNRGGMPSFAGELSAFQSNHSDAICCTE
ncbi:MAG TPA: hypothetical protein VG347_13560, partial [Verrucomicrobiae bacterium]|nr:hypothetical protein [Verrucomicrobiae bacterium]